MGAGAGDACSRLLLVAATAEIVLDGAAGHLAADPEIARDRRLARPGIGERLGYRVFLIALLVATGAYARAAACSPRRAGARCAISKRWAIVARSAALHADRVRRADPALDRRLQLHRLRPHGRRARPQPLPARPRRDRRRSRLPLRRARLAAASPPPTGRCTRCSPIRSRRSASRARCGAMKLEALLASAGTLALTWRCARARGFDPVLAILVVGANPLYVIYGLGGAHNDLIMMLAMMARGRPHDRAGRARAADAKPAPPRSSSPARSSKATVAVLLPFMIVSRRRARADRSGRSAALALGALIGYAAFGVARHRRRRRAQPRRRVRLHRQLRHRDRPPVRQAGRVPRRPRPAQGRARADRRCTCCGAPGAAMTGSPPPAGRCWRSPSRAPGCSPGTSSGRCRSRSSRRDRRLLAATLAVQGLFIIHQTLAAAGARAMSGARRLPRRAAARWRAPAGVAAPA